MDLTSQKIHCKVQYVAILHLAKLIPNKVYSYHHLDMIKRQQREVAKMRNVPEADALLVMEHGQTDFSARFFMCTRFQGVKS